MRRMAPLTKLILTLTVTIWAFLTSSVVLLAAIVVFLALTGVCSRLSPAQYKAMLSLVVFAGALSALQYAFGTELEPAVNAGLRMLIMTYLFLLLLGTTRIQDLTAALVSQCRIPYDYAFMLTASLRFIPDLMAEITAVQEAQACRGYSAKGSIFRRLVSYLSIVQPLVLRSISRSETMAMSLELRGFGSQSRTFAAEMALTMKDYAVFGLLAAGTAAILMH